MTVVYNRVALIGLGLIASSMFWSIRRGNLANEVVGYAKSKKTRETAKRIGLCDHVETYRDYPDPLVCPCLFI